MECCGKNRNGKFCSNCGKRLIDLQSLLAYLKYNKNSCYSTYLLNDKKTSLKNYEKWKTWIYNLEEGIEIITNVEKEIERRLEFTSEYTGTLKQIRNRVIKTTLKSLDGNREKTAKRLGIGLRTLYRMLKEIGE